MLKPDNESSNRTQDRHYLFIGLVHYSHSLASHPCGVIIICREPMSTRVAVESEGGVDSSQALTEYKLSRLVTELGAELQIMHNCTLLKIYNALHYLICLCYCTFSLLEY